MQKLPATVTAYKGHLVFNLLAACSIPGEVSTSPDNMGNLGRVQSIMNTGQHLGVSAEALVMLKTVQPRYDDYGDVDWVLNAEQGDTFIWGGGPSCVKPLSDCEGSNEYAVGAHVVVPNEPEKKATDYIDGWLCGKHLLSLCVKKA